MVLQKFLINQTLIVYKEVEKACKTNFVLLTSLLIMKKLVDSFSRNIND